MHPEEGAHCSVDKKHRGDPSAHALKYTDGHAHKNGGRPGGPKKDEKWDDVPEGDR